MVKFQIHSYNIFRDMNYYPVTGRRTDRQTESDAYEPTVQYAQGSKITSYTTVPSLTTVSQLSEVIQFKKKHWRTI